MTHEPCAAVVTRLFPGARVAATTRLAGGVSADVRRVDVDLPDGSRTSVVLRSHGDSQHGHSAELEFQLLQALHRQGVPVAEPLLADSSRSTLEHPFLMGDWGLAPAREAPMRRAALASIREAAAMLMGYSSIR